MAWPAACCWRPPRSARGRWPRRVSLAAVVADDGLAAQAWASAERIAALAPEAARLNKQTLRACRQAAGGAPQAVSDPYAYAAGAEHREGISAFLEKRTPRF